MHQIMADVPWLEFQILSEQATPDITYERHGDHLTFTWRDPNTHHNTVRTHVATRNTRAYEMDPFMAVQKIRRADMKR